MDLFSTVNSSIAPLAEQLRPQSVDDIIGQNKLKKSRILEQMKLGQWVSIILYGPPGCGKTSIAHAISQTLKAHFISLNAIDAGVKQLRESGELGRQKKLQFEERTVLFVDEIHRFNKGQQDVLLPFVEKGDLILIGATTENPSYTLNRALLSRCRLIELERLTADDLDRILQRAEKFLKMELSHRVNEEAWDWLKAQADGDARKWIGFIESISALISNQFADPSQIPSSALAVDKLTLSDVQEVFRQSPIGYDRQSTQHYDIISAFIKSVRGSDADAALYYLARMLRGGEDPLFIARRILILASEDIGNADPRGLQIALDCFKAVEVLGLPEGQWALAQATTYLASAPKSNASYMGLKKAFDVVDQTLTTDIPDHLKSRSLLKPEFAYKYPHDFPKGFVEQNYFPKEVKDQKLYTLTGRGFEKSMIEYRNWLKGNS